MSMGDTMLGSQNSVQTDLSINTVYVYKERTGWLYKQVSYGMRKPNMDGSM